MAGALTRICIAKRRGIDYFNNIFVKKFDNITIIGLLLTLVILFLFQGETILVNPLHIALVAVPLVIQTVCAFFCRIRLGKMVATTPLCCSSGRHDWSKQFL